MLVILAFEVLGYTSLEFRSQNSMVELTCIIEVADHDHLHWTLFQT